MKWFSMGIYVINYDKIALDEEKRNPKMARTLIDLIRPEIDEEINNAVTADRAANLFKYVQNGDMNVDRAAKNANMSITEFIASMKEAGYKVPETA